MPSDTLILDGFLGRPTRWERLRRVIELHGGTASIYPYASTGRLDLVALGRQLIQEVQRRRGPVNVVGYSMGGLVIRTARLLDPTFAIEKAVFINTPHRGTWTAHLWPTPGVRQMRPGSAHLARLNAAAWDVPTLTVYNAFDGIVIPAASTRWASGGEHVRCPVPAHVWPVWSGRVHRQIAEFLTATSPVVAEGMPCPSK